MTEEEQQNIEQIEEAKQMLESLFEGIETGEEMEGLGETLAEVICSLCGDDPIGATKDFIDLFKALKGFSESMGKDVDTFMSMQNTYRPIEEASESGTEEEILEIKTEAKEALESMLNSVSDALGLPSKENNLPEIVRREDSPLGVLSTVDKAKKEIAIEEKIQLLREIEDWNKITKFLQFLAMGDSSGCPKCEDLEEFIPVEASPMALEFDTQGNEEFAVFLKTEILPKITSMEPQFSIFERGNSILLTYGITEVRA